MSTRTPKLTIVVPCYNEEAVLPVTGPLLADELASLVASGKASAESRILLVDDGSGDGTWRTIVDLAGRDPRFIGIRQSRNRGHQRALWAGLMEARGLGCDATITIDCDGQDDISAMSDMMDEYAKGADVVYGVRNDRSSDSFFKRFTAEGFYRLQAAMGVEAVPNHADYRLLSSRVLDALSQFREVNLYLRGLIPLAGFRSAQVGYRRERRVAGESHYGLLKMLSFACDGITSLTIRPIYFVLLCGIALTAAGALALAILCAAGAGGRAAAVVSSVVALVGGLNLVGVGVVGEYVGKAYLESKGRPRAIICERTWDRGEGVAP